MSSIFVKKKITPTKRICLRLKELRKQKKISLHKLAQKTKLGQEYIQALEACEFDQLPHGLIYQKNFIKLYLRALEVDPAPYIAQFIMEEKPQPENTVFQPAGKIHPSFLRNIPFALRAISVAIVLIIFALYLGIQVRHMVEPPPLSVLSPINGMITKKKSITVQGKTDQEVFVFINGTEIANDRQGTFSAHIDLNPGVNTITVTAHRKHGKPAEQVIYITQREASALFSLHTP